MKHADAAESNVRRAHWKIWHRAALDVGCRIAKDKEQTSDRRLCRKERSSSQKWQASVVQAREALRLPFLPLRHMLAAPPAT